MKIMGIDISSRSTGWAVIEDDKLLEYGAITPSKKMSLGQKLCLFSNELNKIITKQSPDEIAVEDVIQVSSVSVTKILARFNGIAIAEAYKYLQLDPPLYMPSEWKKNLDGCTGGAKKAEVQLSVCAKYKLLTEEKIEHYKNRIDKIKAFVGDEDSKKEQKQLLKQLKKQLKKATSEEEIVIKDKIKKLTEDKSSKAKANKKAASEEMDGISIEIYSETSISDDVADAIGCAITLQKSLR